MKPYDHELDPVIFENAAAIQKFCAEGLRTYRRDLVMRLQLTAIDYEHRAAEMLSSDPTQAAWLEGVAEGLRTAAVELDPDRVTA